MSRFGGRRRKVLGDFRNRPAQLAQSQIAVLFRRRAHTNQRNVRFGDGFGRGGDRQPARLDVLPDQIFQPRFVKGRAPSFNFSYFVPIPVDPENAMSKARQTGSRHAPDITKTEYGDVSFFRLQFHPCPREPDHRGLQ